MLVVDNQEVDRPAQARRTTLRRGRSRMLDSPARGRFRGACGVVFREDRTGPEVDRWSIGVLSVYLTVWPGQASEFLRRGERLAVADDADA